MPAAGPVTDLQRILDEVHEACLPLREGRVASYIPELAGADPDLFGLAVCTPQGEILTAGDAEHEFTIQSISKPFVHAWALEVCGLQRVLTRAGVEPTGDAFNSIVRLEEGTHRPHNPMVNAGAIALTGLLCGRAGAGSAGDLVEELLRRFASAAGRDALTIDVPVYLSERATGDRNRAIAHLLHHLGVLEEPVEETLDLYFQQCSALVSCRDLAVMAATLAGGGVNPLTRERVLAARTVERVQSVMSTCGLYDRSGRFAFEVGVPAKSGVAGGLLAVAPGRLGIAAFSPRLGEKGNSVRAMAALRVLAERLDLHAFHIPSRGDLRPLAEAGLGAHLEQVRSQVISTTPPERGRVARYGPRLAAAAPETFGIAVCTVEGTEASAGEVELPFSIQAAANLFTYAIASEHLGSAEVHRHVGVEPSGNPFDAILFDPGTSRPFNPAGNAGAITVCSLIPGEGGSDRLKFLLEGFGRLAGGDPPGVDAAALEDEEAAGERNRAIAHLLRACGAIAEVEPALELYFQQCSVEVNCRVLARMGATLATGGLDPGSGERVLDARVARDVMSLMYTSGLHDGSGRFALEVGTPAKSGISGCIVAVAPGQMGIAVHSPPVDERGNSVRGRAALRELSNRLGLGVHAVGEEPGPA